jgi:hypothetical protein
MRAVLASTLSTAAAAVQIVLLLVVELIATMIIYIYLNLYHIGTFGYLVRWARGVLDLLAGQLDYWMPASANAAYATLLGELGPKSILLLMLGLVTATVIRGIVRFIERRATGKPRTVEASRV